jgi:hypothetical protein
VGCGIKHLKLRQGGQNKLWSSWDKVLEQGTVIAERLAAKTVDAFDELLHGFSPPSLTKAKAIIQRH